MAISKLVVLALTLGSVSCRPKESTHDLLSRLGFDPVQKPGVNYHKKRVADESDKARFNEGSYNSDTDSHMFVVRLPPHHPYYSLANPEKVENEVIAKSSHPMNFPVNGKPAQVYHWNIPLIKKLAKHKKAHKHDSKIVRLKIMPNQEEEYQYYKKLKKEGKPSVYKLKKEHVMSIKELAEQQNDRPIPDHKTKIEHLQNDVFSKDSKFTHILTKPSRKPEHTARKSLSKDSNLTVIKYNSYHPNKVNKYEAEKKVGEKTPLVYSPSIPKHKSFYKYFPGNGKPKSFYVIEKSENPSRFHRLL